MRWHLIPVACLFLSSGASWAEQYTKVSQLSNSLQETLKPQNQATLNLKFEPGLNCSGILVDHEGRALTNLHCIEDCIMSQKAFHEELAYSEPLFVDPMNASNKQFLKKITPDLSKSISCSVKIGINGKKDKVVQAKILHVFGPGFLSPRSLIPSLSEKFPLVRQALKDQGFWGGSGDLVLMQIPQQPQSDCIRIAPIGLASVKTADVFNLAYPAVIRKTNDPQKPIDFVGDGDTLLYSSGQISSSIQFLKSIFGQDSENDVKDILLKGTFLSSTDSEVGASGSPIFSKAGNLIGITCATFNYNQSEYAPWLTLGIDLSIHKKMIENLVPLNKSCSTFME